jgi:L-seryl-tRNA(Ser) seleniumtransferase
MSNKASLKDLPSVDEVLKSQYAREWLGQYPRRYVLEAIRQTIDKRRKLLRKGAKAEVSIESMTAEIDSTAKTLSSFSLKPVINATGIVVHTNLGRAVLSEKVLENVGKISSGYSNLEYDIAGGKRGKRYTHIKRLLREVTGAEDGIAVNNNAAAVLLCLNTLAKGKEVIVSRGELVEIGGSFRVPDVMASSGAVLREVGTTNKTHLHDYENALNENTALILKVHQSNYRITGFTSDVSIDDLVTLGRKFNIPVMYDLGSGCLIDLKPYGIPQEPVVQEIVKSGIDIMTFSGDKLLGGPQAGIIIGRKDIIEVIQKNPLLRAVRIDKLTLSALEATFMEYIDLDRAKENIPTLRMLLEEPDEVKKRARKIAGLLVKDVKNAEIKVTEDYTFAGGGALPEIALKTFVVSIKPKKLTPNRLEERLREGTPPVIARIKEDALIIDARTIKNEEIKTLAACLKAALA